ncbi:hypothetical protein TrCOL_g10136 [Triparma columacea]|nr:hypothetical protein TrCOL_g10136 [Triparma columacea]
MYTCGPTVYAEAHLGNFRAFLTYDILKRVLVKVYDKEVDHVCNLTDVDDKIIKKCRSLKITDAKDLTGKYTDIFMHDLSDLNILPASRYPRATDHIPDIVKMIEDLRDVGLAYRDPDGWWFDVSQKSGYGSQLVNVASLSDEVDIDADGDQDYRSDNVKVGGMPKGGEKVKNNKRDFALWKAYKEGVDIDSLTWDTSLGLGRPGWHIECSAICRTLLGDRIDIHMGGTDLRFPHHENEIAQSEGVMGKECGKEEGREFCQCWVHNGFVKMGEEKMSKSLGNTLTLQSECPTTLDKRAFRYLVVTSHYRQEMTFTSDALNASKRAVERVDKCMRDIKDIQKTGDNKEGGELGELCEREAGKFYKAIADDLSTPRCAASMFAVVKGAEKEIKRGRREGGGWDIDGLGRAMDTLRMFDEVFGILYGQEEQEGDGGGGEVPEDVMELVRKRGDAKAGKDWGLADELRDEIAARGWQVKDSKDGATVVKL